MTHHYHQLHTELIDLNEQLRQEPKNRKIKAAYNTKLDELDEEGQRAELPFITLNEINETIMKIFEFQISGESDYVVAEDMFEAIKFYLDDTENQFRDLDKVIELDKETCDRLQVVFDEGESRSFTDAIEDDERMPPYHLASTAY